ncbi:MAG: hypothetical protein FWG34_07115 [Oscillospiraceae bacterium]|nr:hypothetical protein [Oscillospiraceae bacterium]
MKKILAVVLAAAALAGLFLCACEKKEESGADIDTRDALQKIMESAVSAAGDDVVIPMTFDGEISAENCGDKLGLTPAQFEDCAMDAFYMTAAIGTFAFEVVLAKCESYASAKELKSLAAKGYNWKKWVCVFPEQCFVIDSGRFVLLGAVYDNTAELFLSAFRERFDTAAGDVNKFYEKGDDEPGEAGIGGGLILD